VAARGASEVVEGDVLGAGAAPTLGDLVHFLVSGHRGATGGGVEAWGRVVAVDVVLEGVFNLVVTHVDGAHLLEQVIVDFVVVGCCVHPYEVLDGLAVGADCVGDTLGHVAVGCSLEVILVKCEGASEVIRKTLEALALRVGRNFVQVFQLQLDDQTSGQLVKIGDVGIHNDWKGVARLL
jgi:hypothetical protein